MDEHYPIHHGLVDISLGAQQRMYVPIFTRGVNDFEVTRGVILRPPVTLEEEYAWYDKMVQNGSKSDVVFAILLHQPVAEGTPTAYRYIGNTALHGITWPAGYATSGTIIFDKTCFGKGYGTEAKLLLLCEAFRNRGLHKVCSHVKAFNGNSWGHLLACGYKEVGRRKNHHFVDGTFVDEIILEVFREDWEPIWKQYQEAKTLPRLTPEQRAYLKKEVERS